MLIILIFLLIGVRYLYLPRQDFQKKHDPSSFKKEVAAFQRSLKKEKARENKKNVQKNRQSNKESKGRLLTKNLFEFNPNNLSERGWKKLGLNDGLINVIINYRKNGGVFYKKADLKKIYGLDQALYSKLEPFILIKEDHQEGREKNAEIQQISENKEIEKSPPPVINVNKADTFRLLLVDGIGPTYAKRICKYRELLGGFHTKEQIKEVYGINDTVYKNISKSLEIDTSEIEKINLNNTTFKELIRHPYISAYQTKAILKYIKYKGSISGSEELLDHNIFDKKTYKKVSIYLKP
jgi:DNA uptake protein ComE-like DNA-binding protein